MRLFADSWRFAPVIARRADSQGWRDSGGFVADSINKTPATIQRAGRSDSGAGLVLLYGGRIRSGFASIRHNGGRASGILPAQSVGFVRHIIAQAGGRYIFNSSAIIPENIFCAGVPLPNICGISSLVLISTLFKIYAIKSSRYAGRIPLSICKSFLSSLILSFIF